MKIMAGTWFKRSKKNLCQKNKISFLLQKLVFIQKLENKRKSLVEKQFLQWHLEQLFFKSLNQLPA